VVAETTRLEMKDDAVKMLNELTEADPEKEHGEAEKIILGYLDDIGSGDVSNAYREAIDRCGFLYA